MPGISESEANKEALEITARKIRDIYVNQLSGMSEIIGLMVGLSLADRNIRRLLNSLPYSQHLVSIFSLLKEPEIQVPDLVSRSLGNRDVLSLNN